MIRRFSTVLLGSALGLWIIWSGWIWAGGLQQDQGTLVTLDGLKSRTPRDWSPVETNSQFRVKQFRLPAVNDDKADPELIIYFFGAGGGGSVDANIKRWKGLFIPPEGKTIDQAAK